MVDKSKVSKITWVGIDRQGLRIEGKLPNCYGVTNRTSVEEHAIKDVDKAGVIRFTLFVSHPDGSGYTVCFERIAEEWVKQSSDVLFSRKFPYILAGIMLVFITVSLFLMWP